MADWTRGDDPIYDGFREEWDNSRLREIVGGIPVERLEEICAAERKGHLAIFPCKIGDSIYDNYLGKPKRYTVTGFRLGKLIGDDERHSNKIWNIEYSCSHVSCSSPITNIGKGIYLSRKAAETTDDTQKGQEE